MWSGQCVATRKMKTTVIQILRARGKDTPKQGSVCVCAPVCGSSSRSSITRWSESISVIKSGSGTELLTEDRGKSQMIMPGPTPSGKGTVSKFVETILCIQKRCCCHCLYSCLTAWCHVCGAGWEPRGPFHIKAQQSILFSC